ncbi:MAG: hypothetical protein MHM6MM_006370 [Cercozoa sp. M6MM]
MSKPRSSKDEAIVSLGHVLDSNKSESTMQDRLETVEAHEIVYCQGTKQFGALTCDVLKVQGQEALVRPRVTIYEHTHVLSNLVVLPAAMQSKKKRPCLDKPIGQCTTGPVTVPLSSISAIADGGNGANTVIKDGVSARFSSDTIVDDTLADVGIFRRLTLRLLWPGGAPRRVRQEIEDAAKLQYFPLKSSSMARKRRTLQEQLAKRNSRRETVRREAFPNVLREMFGGQSSDEEQEKPEETPAENEGDKNDETAKLNEKCHNNDTANNDNDNDNDSLVQVEVSDGTWTLREVPAGGRLEHVLLDAVAVQLGFNSWLQLVMFRPHTAISLSQFSRVVFDSSDVVLSPNLHRFRKEEGELQQAHKTSLTSQEIERLGRVADRLCDLNLQVIVDKRTATVRATVRFESDANVLPLRFTPATLQSNGVVLKCAAQIAQCVSPPTETWHHVRAQLRTLPTTRTGEGRQDNTAHRTPLCGNECFAFDVSVLRCRGAMAIGVCTSDHVNTLGDGLPSTGLFNDGRRRPECADFSVVGFSTGDTVSVYVDARRVSPGVAYAVNGKFLAGRGTNNLALHRAFCNADLSACVSLQRPGDAVAIRNLRMFNADAMRDLKSHLASVESSPQSATAASQP